MTTFARRLGLFDLTMLATGAAIGSGVFRTPSVILGHVESPVWMLAVWALGGVVTIAGALTFAELGAMMPKAGGMYVYLVEAYGDLVAFLQGWAYFLVVATGALAALALVFAEYVGYFVPLGPWGRTGVALGALATLAAVNVVGVRVAASVAGALTVLKLAALALLVGLGLCSVPRAGSLLDAAADASSGAVPHGAPTSSAIAAAMVGVLWSYGGWQHATLAAAEAKRPARDVPLGVTLGTALVTVVYLATNAIYLRVLSPSAIIASPTVAADTAAKVLGRAGAGFIAAAIALSAAGTLGIYTLTAPRLYHAMAERGLFFQSVLAIHPRFRTPARAIILQTAWAAVLVLAWGTFESLIAYVVFVDWIFFGLLGAAIFVLRRTRPDAERPYRVVLYPLPPLLFVGVSAWFVVSTLWGQPIQAIAGAVLLALGVPVFSFWKRRSANGAPQAPTRS
jgi:APA family basic amino acid/polyamine antiporter